MALPSTYYYNSNALPTSPRNADLIREIPTFAIHAMNSGYDQGWESNSVQSKAGFEFLASKINVQVPVHLAVPRPVAERHFGVGKEIFKDRSICVSPNECRLYGGSYDRDRPEGSQGPQRSADNAGERTSVS